MASPYFRYLPNFEYVNRLKENKNISAYIQVKNLFKRGKLREDIFQDLTYFTKYNVAGDKRPDNVAFEVYGSQYYDWVVLLSNNIINYENEWPLSQASFNNYLYSKYITDENLYAVRYYETLEVKDSLGRIVVPAGLEVPSNYSVTFYDSGTGRSVTRASVKAVTNYEYENKIDNEKRNIYLLKSEYLNVVESNISGDLLYKKGGSQYINPYNARGENIRLFS